MDLFLHLKHSPTPNIAVLNPYILKLGMNYLRIIARLDHFDKKVSRIRSCKIVMALVTF